MARVDTKLNLFIEKVIEVVMPERFNIFGLLKYRACYGAPGMNGGSCNRGFFIEKCEGPNEVNSAHIATPNNDMFIQWWQPECYFKLSHPALGFVKFWWGRPSLGTLGSPRIGIGLGLFTSDNAEQNEENAYI